MRAHALQVALAICVAAFCPLHAADILLNSDFSDGKTHWQGGGQAPTNMGGKLIVNLDPKKWTVIYQHFASRATVLKLTIVYSLSSDCSLQRVSSDSGDGPLFTSSDLTDACGIHGDFNDLRLGSAIGLAFTVSGAEVWALTHIYPSSTSGGNQSGTVAPTARRTFTSSFDRYWGEFGNDEFCLAFPPGEGTITLMQVTLTKIGN